jgi:hypothetical protein
MGIMTEFAATISKKIDLFGERPICIRPSVADMTAYVKAGPRERFVVLDVVDPAVVGYSLRPSPRTSDYHQSDA